MLEHITENNFAFGNKPKFPVYHHWYNKLVNSVNDIMYTIGGIFTGRGSEVRLDGVALSPGAVQREAVISLTASEIVGNDEGSLNHTGGVTIVPAPGAGYALEFISAVFIYKYAGAAYGGGNSNCYVRVGTTNASSVITDNTVVKSTADSVARVSATAAVVALTPNAAINIRSGTAYTNPGDDAGGVLTIRCTYKIHAV